MEGVSARELPRPAMIEMRRENLGKCSTCVLLEFEPIAVGGSPHLVATLSAPLARSAQSAWMHRRQRADVGKTSRLTC